MEHFCFFCNVSPACWAEVRTFLSISFFPAVKFSSTVFPGVSSQRRKKKYLRPFNVFLFDFCFGLFSWRTWHFVVRSRQKQISVWFANHGRYFLLFFQSGELSFSVAVRHWFYSRCVREGTCQSINRPINQSNSCDQSSRRCDAKSINQAIDGLMKYLILGKFPLANKVDKPLRCFLSSLKFVSICVVSIAYDSINAIITNFMCLYLQNSNGFRALTGSAAVELPVDSSGWTTLLGFRAIAAHFSALHFSYVNTEINNFHLSLVAISTCRLEKKVHGGEKRITYGLREFLTTCFPPGQNADSRLTELSPYPDGFSYSVIFIGGFHISVRGSALVGGTSSHAGGSFCLHC